MSEELVYVDQVVNLGGDAGCIFKVDTNEVDVENMILNEAVMYANNYDFTIDAVEGLGVGDTISGPVENTEMEVSAGCSKDCCKKKCKK